MIIQKCRIQKYNVDNEPLFIILKENIIVEDPELKDGGKEFAARLRGACRAEGYNMRFYSICDDRQHDLDIIVEGEYEQTEPYLKQVKADSDHWMEFIQMVNQSRL